MFVTATDGAYGTCTLFGYVHFLTFDGAHFDYPGVCRYQVATNCGSGPSVFQIYARNEYRDALQQVSWLQHIEIVYSGHTIQLGPGLTAQVCLLLIIIINSTDFLARCLLK